MASFYTRPNSPFYWLSITTTTGTRRRFSSGIRIDSKGGKRQLRLRVEEERRKEQMASTTPEAVFSQWVAQWIQIRHDNPRTRLRYENAWTAIQAFLDSKGITHPSEVEYQHCESWMQWRTSAQAEAYEVRKARWNTALTDLRVLSAIMQEAVRRQFCPSNPCLKTGFSRRNTKQKKCITKEEEKQIEQALKTAPGWMKDCWVVLMKHGCRISETAVPAGQINLTRGTITFSGKGGKDNEVPIHPAILKLAKHAVKTESPLIHLPKSPAKEWWSFFQAIKLPHLSIHCTRVTAATRMRDAGISREDAMEYLGHSSELVHQVYIRANPERLEHIHSAL